MNRHLERSIQLLQHSRPKLAEEEARAALVQEPGESLAHAYLALALNAQDKHPEAIAAAKEAVGLAPDDSYNFYVLAAVQSDAGRLRDAREAINQAIEIDPFDADNFGASAAIFLRESQHEKAAEEAAKGLEIDPEHEQCNNIRGLALSHLGRNNEAGLTLDSNLARNPDNANTHAVKGWHLLREGKTKQAYEHFKESLRLKPGNESARMGLIEAIKARNLFYRGLQKYFFAMASLTPRMRMGVIFGSYILYRIIVSVMNSVPALNPYVPWFIYTYLAFVLSTWIGPKLFNTVVFLHPLGRQALTKREQWASVTILGFIGISAGFFASYFSGSLYWGHLPAIWCLLLLVPVSTFFSFDDRRNMLIAGAISTAMISLVALITLGIVYNQPWSLELLPYFYYSILGYSIAANWIHHTER
ncbi:MAG: tetratricopeptide repeat protein [Verrucomicrobiota bacterium]|nr:tetratricopeptide repeat protein [Verrucomicrobiota bacterium]